MLLSAVLSVVLPVPSAFVDAGLLPAVPWIPVPAADPITALLEIPDLALDAIVSPLVVSSVDVFVRLEWIDRLVRRR